MGPNSMSSELSSEFQFAFFSIYVCCPSSTDNNCRRCIALKLSAIGPHKTAIGVVYVDGGSFLFSITYHTQYTKSVSCATFKWLILFLSRETLNFQSLTIIKLRFNRFASRIEWSVPRESAVGKATTVDASVTICVFRFSVAYLPYAEYCGANSM